MYTGLLCKHSLLAVVEWLSYATTKGEKQDIYEQILKFCNKNWFRKQYFPLPQLHIPEAPTMKSMHIEMDDRRSDFMTRFREIIRVVPYIPQSRKRCNDWNPNY